MLLAEILNDSRSEIHSIVTQNLTRTRLG